MIVIKANGIGRDSSIALMIILTNYCLMREGFFNSEKSKHEQWLTDAFVDKWARPEGMILQCIRSNRTKSSLISLNIFVNDQEDAWWAMSSCSLLVALWLSEHDVQFMLLSSFHLTADRARAKLTIYLTFSCRVVLLLRLLKVNKISQG